MSTATANSIIKSALRLLQVKEVNEPISAEEGADGLVALNDLLDAYTNEDLMQFFRPERFINLVAGKRTYTIGEGGDFNVVRPVSIENAFSRDLGPSDWPIIEINNDQYQRIILKTTEATYPYYFFYKPDYPLGEIAVWPVPGPNLEMHINVRSELDTFADINTALSFPPGYIRMLKYNLAVEIAPEYRDNVPKLVLEQAMKAKEHINDTNDKNIPELISDLMDWPGDLGHAWFSGGAAGGGDGTAGDVIFTESGTAGITITETGSETVVITEVGSP